MSVAAPWVLLLAVVAVIFVAVDALRPWAASAGRKAVAVVVRTAVLLLLVLGLAQPSVPWAAGSPTLVFLVDRSASVSPARVEDALDQVERLWASAPSGNRVGVVMVDAAAEVVVAPGESWARPAVETKRPARTDLGHGIQVALGLIDPAAGGRIVLLSDGGDTGGKALEGAASARALGVPIDVIALGSSASDDAIVGLDPDEDVVRPGSTLGGVVRLRGGPAGGTGRLLVMFDDETIFDRSVALPAGDVTRVRFSHALPATSKAGPRALRAVLSPPGFDEDTTNNAAAAGVVVGPIPKVLLVSTERRELEAIGRALRAERFGVDPVVPAELGVEDLLDADLVVIGDVAVAGDGKEGLDPEVLPALRRWVSAGGGLITLGGDRTYELGGWGDTELARVLPLDLRPDSGDVEPAVSMVQILDSSASMGDWTGRHTKMALANRAAVASMQMLREKDYLGVMAVDTEVHWRVRLQPVTDPLRLQASINSIKPTGGGIFTYTALVAAEESLVRAETPLRHVVLYADAQDAEEQVKGIPLGWGQGPTAQEVAARLRDKGVTVSVIALGEQRDQHRAFLESLAHVGGGRFHITQDPNQLRALFVEETRQVVQTVVHDVSYRVRQEAPHPALEGVDLSGAPPLLGYVEVQARDTATLVLSGPTEVPVLATWQYGLGQVASWSTDLGPRWGRRWLGWRGYPRLVVQMSRWALRPPLARGAGIEVRPGDGGVEIEVVRRGDDGLALADGLLRGSLEDDAGVKTPVPLEPVAPGRWLGHAEVPAGAARTLVVEDVTAGEEVARQEIVVPPWKEHASPDATLLPELAARTLGEVAPASISAAPPGPGRPVPVAWLPVILAGLLLPLDAWLRRPARAG